MFYWLQMWKWVKEFNIVHAGDANNSDPIYILALFVALLCAVQCFLYLSIFSLYKLWRFTMSFLFTVALSLFFSEP